MITYKFKIDVYLSNKLIGYIKQHPCGMYYYSVKGSNSIGDLYNTVQEVKDTL